MIIRQILNYKNNEWNLQFTIQRNDKYLSVYSTYSKKTLYGWCNDGFTEIYRDIK